MSVWEYEVDGRFTVVGLGSVQRPCFGVFQAQAKAAAALAAHGLRAKHAAPAVGENRVSEC